LLAFFNPLIDVLAPPYSVYFNVVLFYKIFINIKTFVMDTIAGISQSTFKRISAFASILCLVAVQSFSQNKPAQSGYAPVNGLKMYYEVYGEGKPLVLLHGAFNTIPMAFGMLIPELSKSRQIIAVEMQGHGRTRDIDRPFSFESMADDVAALLKYLKKDSADIFGYSMGGCVAWQLAIRHPEAVKKLVVASAVYKYEGWTPETRAILPNITPEVFEHTPIKSQYDSLSPDPKHWTEFINKMKKFIITPYDFGAEKIRAIKSPTLIIAGDGDGERGGVGGERDGREGVAGDSAGDHRADRKRGAAAVRPTAWAGAGRPG
jgi:pimeloyl-ACP methyl ester carboxylesterase